MNDTNENNPLGYEKLSVLLKRFAIPSIIAMVVSSFTILSTRFLSDRGWLFRKCCNKRCISSDYDLSCDHTFDQYWKCLLFLSFTW